MGPCGFVYTTVVPWLEAKVRNNEDGDNDPSSSWINALLSSPDFTANVNPELLGIDVLVRTHNVHVTSVLIVSNPKIEAHRLCPVRTFALYKILTGRTIRVLVVDD